MRLSVNWRPNPPSPDAARLQRELAEVKAALQGLTTELRQLREAGERRTVPIDKVEQMTVEQLFHIIGRLEVDDLGDTLNVGISRNLAVGSRGLKPKK
jgi:hypothetical protein